MSNQTGVNNMAFTRIIPVFVLVPLILSLPAAAVEDSTTPQIAGKPANAAYPFIAKVTGNNVYVRSGKGTAYYDCGKVNLNDQVTVTGEAFGWAEIVPPAGSYSWIHKNYVDVKQSNTTIGVLTGDNVRVWAGSDTIEPMRSSSMQTKLNTGEIVELFADQPADCDYYKIKPPAGARLTINCTFLRYVGPVESEQPVKIPPQGTTEKEKPADLPPATETKTPTFKNVETDKTPGTPDTEPATEPATEPVTEPDTETKPPAPAAEQSENLKACYALAEQMDQERKKTLAAQNYDDIKKKLEAIKADTTDPEAATNAQVLLDRIARYELASLADKEMAEDDKSLAKKKEKIEKARQEQLENVHRDADYIYVGVLKVSHVYTQKTGQKRYMLQGPDGKILCYVLGASEAVAGRLESMVGKRVGIKGEVSGDTKSLVTLISTTAVDPM